MRDAVLSDRLVVSFAGRAMSRSVHDADATQQGQYEDQKSSRSAVMISAIAQRVSSRTPRGPLDRTVGADSTVRGMDARQLGLVACGWLVLVASGCGEAIDNFKNSEHQGAFILGRVRGIAFNLSLRNANTCLLDAQDQPTGCILSDGGGEFVFQDLPERSQQRVLLRNSGYWPLIGMINTARSVANSPVWEAAMMDNFVVDLQAKKVDREFEPGTGLLYFEIQEPDGDEWKGAQNRQVFCEQLGTPYYFNDSNWLDKNRSSTASKGSAIFVNVKPGWYSIKLPDGCGPFWGFDLDERGLLPTYVAADTVTELNVRCR